jgi:myo-inositol-1(or 4)-monophosphatase
MILRERREMKREEGYGVDEFFMFAADTVRQAGEVALSYYGKGDPRVRFDDGLVTEAELRLSDLFRNRLLEQFPGHRVFGSTEESNEYSHEGKRYLWVYDALDGVANFQGGIPTWGMSVALLDNFWPVFGLFFMPVTGDLFRARAGGRAYWGDLEIHAATSTEINDESILLTYSRFNQDHRSTFPGKILNLGCTVAHICLVARGRADAAMIAKETYQDLAAASVIVETAGGKIYRLDGSEIHLADYLGGQKIEEPLLVTAPDNYPQIREHLQ